MKKITITLIILLGFVSLKAQRVENVRVTSEDGKIVVLYDLNKYSERYLYDVDIYFQSTTKITPFALSGDVGEQVLGGKDRKIVWDLYQDIDGLSGNLKAIVNITGKERIKHLGGPSNMLLSMMVPGMGDYFVQKGKFRPIMTHVAFYFSTAATINYFSMANDEYKKYKNSIQQDEINGYYQNVEDLQRTAYIFASVTAAIWLQDVIHVTVRGSKNNKIHPYRGGNSVIPSTSAYVLPTRGGAQIGLVYNF